MDVRISEYKFNIKKTNIHVYSFFIFEVSEYVLLHNSLYLSVDTNYFSLWLNPLIRGYCRLKNLLDLKVRMHTKLLAISCLIKMVTIKHTMYAGAGEVAQ